MERATPKDLGVGQGGSGERLESIISGQLEATQLALGALELGAVDARGVDVVSGEAGDDVWPVVELDVQALSTSMGVSQRFLSVAFGALPGERLVEQKGGLT
ncbi:hypothetical protein G6O67_003327 [Ophiocordyceps sinensis]|uniref:Uncharacterized protein n=1 Tax=Ophiocordyceps sinensis TaxID=72228 RepID=A0A8H4PWJ4_9HYPO|nr:hypothetical protein G6O67_003327 [Ophiocordyceps sinensis]